MNYSNLIENARNLKGIKNLWSTYEFNFPKSSGLESLNVDIKFRYNNGMTGKIRLHKLGVTFYDDCDHSVGLVEFIDNMQQGENYICSRIGSEDSEFIIGNGLQFHLTEDWDEDYYVYDYESKNIFDENDTLVTDLNERIFQKSTIQDNVRTPEEIVDMCNAYDTLMDIMKTDGIQYIYLCDDVYVNQILKRLETFTKR